jgi:Ankyrin repeats (many copies)
VIELNASDSALVALARSIAEDDAAGTLRLLDASPALARASLEVGVTRKTAKAYLDEFGRYFFAGDTALHIAAGAYRVDIVQRLIEMGADVHARNRRGAAPLHLAAVGLPGSPTWNPQAQQATITCLIAAGADPDAVDKDGVTPLHRAVRTRCAAAVSALLAGGADAKRKNNNGSTPMWLAAHNTGRGGSGSAEAKAQQKEIVRLLEQQVERRP